MHLVPGRGTTRCTAVPSGVCRPRQGPAASPRNTTARCPPGRHRCPKKWLRSCANELNGRVAAPAGTKAADVLQRTRRRVLFRVRTFDSVADPLASGANRSHANLSFAHLYRTDRIVEQCAIPAAGLLLPRPCEHATVDYNGPDADEAMIGTRTCADAQNLAFIDRRHDRARQTAQRGLRHLDKIMDRSFQT